MTKTRRSLGLLTAVFLLTSFGVRSAYSAAPAPAAIKESRFVDDEAPPLPIPSTNKLISMNFDGAMLRDVLRILSQQSGLSFAASEEVETKKVTVYLENVPVKDAIESILNANGLKYEHREGSNVFVVYPAESTENGMVTKVYILKYKRLSTSPSEIGSLSVISDLLKPEEVTALSTGTSSGGAAAGAAPAGTAAPAAETAGTLMAERGIDKIVASLLSENGKIAVDLWTNAIIVTDTPATLAKIDRVLKKIDVPTEQVLIEVHFVEVKKSIIDDMGVDWGGDDGALAAFTGGSRTTGFPFTERFFDANKGVQATTQGTSTLTLGSLSAVNFKATLRYIATHSDAKVLARPRVLTFNNEAANIKLVTRAAVASTSTLSASEGVTTVTTGQAERADVGISLKMTPQINDKRYVSLFLEPSVTTVTPSAFFPTTFLDPTTRSVRTTARVRDGETIVIGGLIDRDDQVSIKQVPGLGSIPLLGNAFKYKSRANTERELVVFITPHIVEGTETDGVLRPEENLAVKRSLDYFVESEVGRTVTPMSELAKANSPIYREEQKLIGKTSKRSASPALDKEMTRALDSLNKK